MGRPVIRHLPLRLLVAGAGLYPVLSFGLGLSDIQMDSRLNQPLRARIEILDVSDDEWKHIQARLHRESDPETLTLHPEILDSLTIRALQDDHDRHFVEIRSTQPLAEPLFDLPVEVAGSSGRVIRNYSVMLDPPGPGEDLPQALASSQPQSASHGAARSHAADSHEAAGSHAVAGSHALAASQVLAGSREDTQAPSAAPTSKHAAGARQRHANHRHPGARLETANLPAASGHAAAPSHAAAASRTDEAVSASESASAPGASTANSSSEQTELIKQLETLQQTLAQMQQTISAQNAQIADLTAKVARAESAHSQTPHAAPALPPAKIAASPDVDASDTDAAEDEGKPRSYFWLAVAIGLTTVVILATTILIKWRAGRSAHNLRANDPAASTRRESANQGETGASRSLKRTGTAPALTTPAAQQRQMEADGRVQIDWGKELWNKPEWLRLFGEQRSTSSRQDALGSQPAALEHAEPASGPHTSEPPVSKTPALETTASETRASETRASETPASETPASESPASESPASDRLASDRSVERPARSTMVDLGPADLDELAKSYFADLPKVSTAEMSGATTVQLPKAAASDFPDTVVAEGPVTMTSRLLGEETTKLANAYAAAIRERNTGNQPDTTNADTAKLTEVDPTELLESDMANLSEEDAARLLAADLTNLTEADLDNLTEADLVALTKADAAKLAEATVARAPDEGTVTDPSRLRRRAGHR